MTLWNTIYEQSDTVWGFRPDHALIDLGPQVPPGRVLDLGMGEGRNALPFAVAGCTVRGVDSAPDAVAKCQARAAQLNIRIDAHVGDFLEEVIAPDSLSLVISTMAVQFVRRSQSDALFARIKAGLRSGGFVYLTTFSTEDPSYERLKSSSEPIETNTFYSERMQSHIQFFTRADLLAAFDGLTLIHVADEIMRDPGHPGVPDPHYHGRLMYIGQKP